MAKYRICSNRKIDEQENKIINFNKIDSAKKILKKELRSYLKKLNIKKGDHIFIVGLGNDNYTADSVGPKTLKHINVNSYISYFKTTNDTLVSALEPGVLGETGIKTSRIIESVVKEIKPDITILIDSFICESINELNSTIKLNNIGIDSGNRLFGTNSNISFKTLKVPVIVIGVPTAIEVKVDETDNRNIYFLSTKDIDKYVDNISKIIAESLNEVINEL